MRRAAASLFPLASPALTAAFGVLFAVCPASVFLVVGLFFTVAMSRSMPLATTQRMTKREAASNALVAMIDELGDLEREVQPVKAKIARAEALRAAVRAAYKGRTEPNLTAEGERWRVLLGPPGNQSSVDTAALLKLIGPTAFSKLASVSIEGLKNYAAPDVLAAVVSTQPTGPRQMTIIPLDPN